jgi:predicted negative regulator of RcsB-dependent stress response
MPRVIKKKIKKKSVETEAGVKDRLSEIRTSIKSRQKTLIVSSAIVLILITGITVFSLYRYSSNEKSRQLEYSAYKYYYNLYQQKPLSKQEQFQQAVDLFKKAYDKRNSPGLLFYIANSYYELEKYDEAIKTLNDFEKKYPGEKDLMPLVYQKMANIYLKTGKTEDALKTLDSLYKSEGNIYKDLALIESGRILEKSGKKTEAEAKFKELIEKFPASPFFSEAKTKTGEKKEG